MISVICLKWLKKYCASYFSVFIDPIHQVSRPCNCFVLKTERLTSWKREKKILLSISPFKPYEKFELIEAFAQDRTKLALIGNDGKKTNYEHLHVYFLLRETSSLKYYTCSIDYLPDTRLSFGGGLSMHRNLEAAKVAWRRFTDLSENSSSNGVVVVTQYLSKPSLFDEFKFDLGKKLVEYLNMKGLPSYKEWTEEIKKIAVLKNMENQYSYINCKSEYWLELYNAGYSSKQAFGIGTNPQNWTGTY